MIPKVIHYCWLSSAPMSIEIKKCIDSWREKLPDYRFKKWDTYNFDIHSIDYVKEAYDHRKWAFASDYIRLHALYNEGGIYLDVDVFVIEDFNDFLNNGFFSALECYPGQNDEIQIQAAVIGAVKGHPFVKDCMDYYIDKNFVNVDGTFNELIAPIIYAKKAEKYGFQYINKKQALAEDIMLYSIAKVAPSPDYVVSETKLVHCCAGSWRCSEKTKFEKLKYTIKNSIVYFLVSIGAMTTWNWKRKFKNMQSSLANNSRL